MIILKAEEQNWSLRPSNYYDTITWEVHDSGHYERVVTFNNYGVKKVTKGALSPVKRERLKELIEMPWPEMDVGCDGVGWCLIAYDKQGREKQSGVLEEITRLLPRPRGKNLYCEEAAGE